MAGKLQFVVEVTADQATKGFQAISHGLEEVGVKGAVSLRNLKENARTAANEGVGGLAHAFKEFKSEQVQQGRVVGFYVRELAEFTGAGKTAQETLKGLGGVLAEIGMSSAKGFGKLLGIGVALEAAKLLIGVVRSHIEEAEKVKKAWEDAYKSVSDFATEASDKLATMELKARGFTEAMISAVQAMNRAKTIKLPTGEDVSANEALVIAGAKRAEIQAQFYRAKDLIPAARGLSDEEAIKVYPHLKKIVDLAAPWRELADRIEEADQRLRDLARTVDNAEIVNKNKKAAADAQDALAKSWQEDMAVAGQARDNAAIAVPPELLLKSTDVLGKGPGSTPPLFAGSPEASRYTAWPQEDWERAATDAGSKALREGDTQKGERLKKQLEQIKQAGSDVADIFAGVGAAFGKSAGQMSAMFGKLIQQAIQLGIAMSTASGPFGWLSVAAAAAAIIATVTSVPEFKAAGGSVAAGRPYIVGERGPELMVPGQSGTIVPNHMLGGGGITFNITTPDARSFRTMLESNSGELIDALNTWRRDRRLA